MYSLLKVAAVAVFALAVGLGIDRLNTGGPDIGAAPAPSPSATPEGSPLRHVPALCPDIDGPHLLSPGRYVMTGGSGDCSAPPLGWPDRIISVEVPEGWTHYGTGKAGRLDRDLSPRRPGGSDFQMAEVASMTADLCGASASLGPTVDDLVKALEAIDHPGVVVTDAQDITLGGYDGKRIDVTVPTRERDCDGSLNYSLMQTTSMNNGVWGSGSGPGWTQRIWILDVEGTRFVVDAMHAQDASPESVDEADRIVRSIPVRFIAAALERCTERSLRPRRPQGRTSSTTCV